jgi:precorrin-2/cobalt-factor-2 C20-methyltransferase
VKGKLIGVGVGPGDPELLTLKAYRLIQSAPAVSFIENPQGDSQSKSIAQQAINPQSLQIPVVISMSRDRLSANSAYEQAAITISRQLDQGRDVVFLCEGDPLFYGSFAYLLELLQGDYDCQSVPGISSVFAASSLLCQPLATLKDSFAVLNGRNSDEQILQALAQHDALVIMKAGQARPRILKLLKQAGRIADARYLEYIGRDQQKIVTDVTKLENREGSYFSLFVITAVGAGRD